MLGFVRGMVGFYVVLFRLDDLADLTRARIHRRP
ncbi:hypothetical protein AERO9AM_20969 [Aeromicrobium sp. 9AM]|nr:hypothetical protein AERO9AM_20969 [Aeromicrobium sp. 9AM]